MVESNGPESAGDCVAWVQWAVSNGAVTSADVASIWGYGEELASQWIAGWAIDRGWAEELNAAGGIERVWQRLCAEVWADGQVVAGTEQGAPAAPALSEVWVEGSLQGGTGGRELGFT